MKRIWVRTRSLRPSSRLRVGALVNSRARESAVATASGRRDDGRGAVAQDFGHAVHDLGGVVANADDRVRAELAGVLQDERERVRAGRLAELRQKRDVAADERL